MNDWYNDPPESPDPPQCPKCEEWDTEVKEDGRTVHCLNCGHAFMLPVEPEPVYDTLDEKEMDLEPASQDPNCPHGNPWGECDHCDYCGDIAYDTWRERQR